MMARGLNKVMVIGLVDCNSRLQMNLGIQSGAMAYCGYYVKQFLIASL